MEADLAYLSPQITQLGKLDVRRLSIDCAVEVVDDTNDELINTVWSKVRYVAELDGLLPGLVKISVGQHAGLIVHTYQKWSRESRQSSTFTIASQPAHISVQCSLSCLHPFRLR